MVAVDDARLVLFVAGFKVDGSFSFGGDVNGKKVEVVAAHCPQSVVVFATFFQRADFLILLKRRAGAVDKQRAVGDSLLHGFVEVAVAREEQDASDTALFDEGEESFHFADGFSIVDFAAFGFVEDLRAVGEDLHGSGGSFEFGEEPVQLGFAPDAAGFRRGVVVFQRRVFVVAVFHKENLQRAVPKSAENAGRFGGTVGRVAPHSPKREQGFFFEREGAVGVVRPIIMITPNRIARNATKHCLKVGMIARDQITLNHALQRSPISRLTRSFKVPITAVSNNEIRIVAEKNHHVRFSSATAW